MLNLKKTTLAVISLGSAAAFAGTMGPVCSAVNVTVPCENTAWDFGGRALYLQPTSSATPPEETFSQQTSTSIRGANPTWGWGFQLEGSYHYSTGNDFNLNWYHFRSGGQTRVLGQDVVLSSTRTVNSPSANSISPAWDQVNMEFGQHVDFGENKFARFHGGMNFSRVGVNGYDYTLENAGGGTSEVNTTRNFNRAYNGFGPRVGVDLNYEWGNGVGVYATGALSLLAGSSKDSVTYQDWETSANSFNNGTNRTTVVSELDAKLGAMYTYAMAQGDLSLDLGWIWANYTNPLYRTVVLSKLDTTDTERGFGIQGLYFGMKWVGKVA